MAGDIECPTCGVMTPERFNFCRSCRHKIRDLKGIFRLGPGVKQSRKMEMFARTGDPAVFARPGAPDYNPAYD